MVWTIELAREDLRPLFERAGLLDPSTAMELPGESIKALPDREVLRIELEPGRWTYLKRYTRIPFKTALRDRWAAGYRSAVGREWQALRRLAELQIPAPEVLLRAEEGGALCRRGYLLTAELDFSGSLEDLIYARVDDASTIEARAAALADLMREMHAGGLNHRDAYLGHIVLTQPSGKLGVIDLNRADLRSPVAWRWRVKDLTALHFSAPERLVSSRVRLRFLVRYAAPGERREMARAILRKARAMRRRVERRIKRGAPNHHINE